MCKRDSSQPTAAQALGSVVPMLLLTEQLDAEMVLGEIGKSVRGCMAKGVTLITILFCVPFAVFALISGNWKTGAISIGIVVVGVWIAFKLVELRLRRGFKAGLAEVRQETQSNAPGEQAVAGPTEPRQRRDQLNRLLNRAGMPCVADIEPHFVPRFPGVA